MSTAARNITTRELVDGVVEQLERRRHERLERDSGHYQRRNPIASDIDPDSCLRRQVLQIVKWDEAQPFDTKLKARLEAGRYLEREASRELLELGFEFIHQQVRFELERRGKGGPALTGKIDGKIAVGVGREVVEIPVEIKSLHPRNFEMLNTVDDLLASPWYRKWPFQMQSYLLGNGLEVGFFWVTDCLGHWKAIVIEIDYETAERVWAFAERILDATDVYRETKALPPETEDRDQCFRCPFFKRSCQPEVGSEGAWMFRNGMLEKALAKRAELEEAGKEYAKLDRKVKKWLKGFQEDEALKNKDLVIVGNYIVEFEEKPKASYTVPARIDRIAKIRHIGEDIKIVTLRQAQGELKLEPPQSDEAAS